MTARQQEMPSKEQLWPWQHSYLKGELVTMEEDLWVDAVAREAYKAEDVNTDEVLMNLWKVGKWFINTPWTPVIGWTSSCHSRRMTICARRRLDAAKPTKWITNTEPSITSTGIQNICPKLDWPANHPIPKKWSLECHSPMTPTLDIPGN